MFCTLFSLLCIVVNLKGSTAFLLHPKHDESIVARWAIIENSFSGEQEGEQSYGVGDYVKGVHGGKYQFDNNLGGPGSLSFAGQEFADSLYASSSEESEEEDNEPMPRWAQRMGTMQDLDTLLSYTADASSTVEIGVDDGISVVFVNQERSWEPFYAKVLRANRSTGKVTDVIGGGEIMPGGGNNATPYSVTPLTGKLAPRGGASNLCDPSKPYSDSVSMHVQFNTAFENRYDKNEDCYYFLVAGTEEETNYYRLK